MVPCHSLSRVVIRTSYLLITTLQSLALCFTLTIMSVNDGNVTTGKQTLLQKFDMHVECLSFEHIDKCSNTRELEKIIKVLR